MSHYETLEVSRNASPEIIRAAYKSLIQRHHPDKNPNNAEAATKAQQISVAYAVLSVPESRAAYDLRLIIAEKLSANSEMPQTSPAGVMGSPKSPATRAGPAASPRKAAQPKKNGARAFIPYFWTTVAAVAMLTIGVMSDAESKRKKKQEVEASHAQMLAQRQADIDKAEKELREREMKKKKAEQVKALDLSRRTLPLFPKGISVNLIVPRSYPPQLSGRALTIPQTSVTVGKIDSELVLANVQRNQQVIIQDVSEQLSRIDDRVLITVGAEAHVKQIIKTTINKITLGAEYKEEELCKFVSTQQAIDSNEWQCRAIESVELPHSFVLLGKVCTTTATAWIGGQEFTA